MKVVHSECSISQDRRNRRLMKRQWRRNSSLESEPMSKHNTGILSRLWSVSDGVEAVITAYLFYIRDQSTAVTTERARQRYDLGSSIEAGGVEGESGAQFTQDIEETWFYVSLGIKAHKPGPNVRQSGISCSGEQKLVLWIIACKGAFVQDPSAESQTHDRRDFPDRPGLEAPNTSQKTHSDSRLWLSPVEDTSRA